MDQQKIGTFLKELRKEKGWTQEELGDKLYTTGRTVSRWETGTNMPDLTVLIELSELYEVDIREIINGEREKGNLSNNINDALKTAAEYAEEEKNILREKSLNNAIFLCCTALFVAILETLFQKESAGYLYGLIPENICSIIYYTGTAIGGLIMLLILASDHKIDKQLEKYKNK